MNRCALLVAPAALALAAASASAINVNIELSLLVDVSGSIDNTEYDLQRQGYANTFSNPNFFNNVVHAGNSIAVNFVEWSGAGQQSELVGWTQISSQADANAFAAAILAPARPFSGSTSPGEAINFAFPRIFSNNFTSDRQIIDISSDGEDNVHISPNNFAFVEAARASALAAGVDQINALTILGDPTYPNLHNYYATHVQGGTGSFTTDASSFADFSRAIAEKIQLEVSGAVPLPSAAGLGFVGLGVLGARRRRR